MVTIAGMDVGGGKARAGGGGLVNLLRNRVTLPITDVLGGIKKGMDTIVRASPDLTAAFKELGLGLRMILLPIGQTISNFLRPWILKFNRVAFKFYEDYIQEGGLWGAIRSLVSGITGIDKDDAGKVIGATLLFGAVAWGAAGSFISWIAASTGLSLTKGALTVSLLAAFGGFIIGKEYGYSDITSGLLGILAAGGIFLAGGAWKLAVAVTIIGSVWLDDKLQEWQTGFRTMIGLIDEVWKGLSGETRKTFPLEENFANASQDEMMLLMAKENQRTGGGLVDQKLLGGKISAFEAGGVSSTIDTTSWTKMIDQTKANTNQLRTGDDLTIKLLKNIPIIGGLVSGLVSNIIGGRGESGDSGGTKISLKDGVLQVGNTLESTVQSIWNPMFESMKQSTINSTTEVMNLQSQIDSIPNETVKYITIKTRHETA
jgi:hypothetical protein